MLIRTLSLIILILCGMTPAADHSISVDAATVVRTLSPTFHGVNYVAFWDAEQGSAGSREALRRAGVQLIRFPGGVPGNLMDWEHISGSWAGTDTDALWEYARAVGAKLMLQTNPFRSEINDAGTRNDTTGAHAGAWVSYCAAGGIDAPLWEVGNEPEGEAPISWNYPAKDSVLLRGYLRAFNDHAAAMHAANSSITVMGPAAANTWYWWAQGLLEVFLDYCDDNTDAISLHWYGDASTYDAITGFAQGWYDAMAYIRSQTQKPLYITEWNNHAAAGNINTTIGNAIVNADVIGVFARTGVAGHAWFGCIHGASNAGYGAWGIFYGSGESRPLDTPTPAYFILPLWTAMGPMVLDVTNTADTVNLLSSYAHKKADGSVQVMLVNKSSQRSVDVGFSGFNPAGHAVRRYELRSSNGSPDDDNVVYNNEQNPAPATQDLPAPADLTCDESNMTVTLPAYSVTVLDFLSGNATRRIREKFPPAYNAPLQISAMGKYVLIKTVECGSLSLFDARGKTVARREVNAQSTTRIMALPGIALVIFQGKEKGIVRTAALNCPVE